MIDFPYTVENFFEFWYFIDKLGENDFELYPLDKCLWVADNNGESSSFGPHDYCLKGEVGE